MLITVIHIFDKLLETLYILLNIELLNCSVIIKRVYNSLSYYNRRGYCDTAVHTGTTGTG